MSHRIIVFVIILLSSLVASCNLSKTSEKIVLYLSEDQEILPSESKIEYVNGKVNFYLTIKSNNKKFLVINGITNIYLPFSLEKVLFSNSSNKFVVVWSSNNTKYVLFGGEVLKKLYNVNDVFISGNTLVVPKLTLHSDISNFSESSSFSIVHRGNFKYLVLNSGKEFGPFIDLELPSQTIDGKNWWIVGKTEKGSYVLIINGEVVCEAEEVGIPSFYDTNYVVNIKKNLYYYIVLNGRTFKHRFVEVESPIFYGDKWMAITKSNDLYLLISGRLDSENFRIIYATSNKIFYPLYDSYSNAWIIEESDKKSFLVKNFKKIFGPYEEIYFYQISNTLVFVYRTNNNWFIRNKSSEYGPYGFVGDIIPIKGDIIFYVNVSNQNYLFYRKNFSVPYDRIINLSVINDKPIAVVEKNKFKYVLIGFTKEFGPYEEVFWNTFSYRNGRFLFTFLSNNNVFINYSSKVYGPYKNVFMPILSDDGNMWGAGVMFQDNTFSLLFNGNVIGSYINADYDSIRFDSKRGKWGGITQKTNGFYITTSYFEFGPFERVFQLKFSKDLSKAKFSVKENGRIFLVFVERDKIVKKLGPYEMAVFVNDNFSDNTMVFMKNKEFFVSDDKNILGPYKYIKDIRSEGSRYYFIYGENNIEGIVINGKKILEMKKIIKYSNLLSSHWYVVGFDKGGELVNFANGAIEVISVFVDKESLLYDRVFSYIIKDSEWQYLLLNGKEIGPFNYIDNKSIIYDLESGFYAFLAAKNGKKFLVSSLNTFGPYSEILKFLYLGKNYLIYLIRSNGRFVVMLNGVPIFYNVIDFDVDYKKENISFLIQERNKVIIKTMKVADLLNR